MAGEVFAQRSGPGEPWHLYGPMPASRIHLWAPLTLTYADGTAMPPAPDTLAPEVDALTLVGPGMPTVAGPVFDRTQLWIVGTVVGSGTLFLVLRSQQDDLTDLLPSGSSYTLLAKITATEPLDYQE